MNVCDPRVEAQYVKHRRTIARRIIQLRELKGMSQEQLEKAVWLSHSTLTDLESATSLKDTLLCPLYRIAQELTVDLKNLFVPGIAFQPSPYFHDCKGLYYEISMNVYNRKKKFRYTQEQLASAAFLHKATVSGILDRAKPVSLKQLIKLACALELGPLDLF